MESTDDQRIISRVLKGDCNAFGILVQKYQKPVFNLMFRMTGSQDQAADLAQETFIKVYENLERFRPGSRFFPWLYAIGLNHARDFLRKNKARRSSEKDFQWAYCSSQVHEKRNTVHDYLDFQRLEQALMLTPMKYREAVILRYHEEFSMLEIAKTMQISVSAAKMRVSRGLEMVRGLLKRGTYEG